MQASTDFLAQLFDNPLFARLLKLFLNTPEHVFSLGDIKKRLQIGSKPRIMKELGRLERLKIIRAQLLKTSDLTRGRAARPQKMWGLNAEFPYAAALRTFVRSVGPGADAEPKLLERLRRAGRLRLLIVSTSFIEGGEGEAKIDLLLVGDILNEKKLETTLRAIEAEQGREIRYAAFSPKEYAYRLDVQDRLIRDLLDYPHRILFDRLHG